MSTIRVNNILDAGGGSTTTFNGIPLRPGAIDPDNRIINGAFDFWQRGTSFTTLAYGADRWINGFVGGTVTMSRQSFALGDTLGSNSPTYFLRQTVSGQTLASQYAQVSHRIEGVRSYAGQTITILGWVRRSSGAGNIAVRASQFFGTGGSPSSQVAVAAQTITLTSTWEPFAATFSIPSITGKTLGTDGNDFLSIAFWTSAGSDYNAATNSLGLQTIGVDFWGIHIKLGTHTTSAVALYKQPELGPELARCQRYYTKLGGEVVNDIIIQGAASTTTAMAATLTLPVTMRAAPTLTKVGTWTAFNAAQPSVVATSTTTCSINFAGTVASLGPASVSTSGTTTFLTADAEI